MSCKSLIRKFVKAREAGRNKDKGIFWYKIGLKLQGLIQRKTLRKAV
jgi:hypothetical protein